MQQGTMVMNMVRKGAIRTGLPVTVAGTTIDRQCASGLQAIAVAARSVMLDGVEVAVAGGAESINLVLNDHAEEQCLDPMRIERPLLAPSGRSEIAETLLGVKEMHPNYAAWVRMSWAVF